MRQETVHLFIFDSMSDWEYGYLVAGLNNPQFQKAPGRFAVKTVSLGGKPATSGGGLRVQADSSLEQLEPRNSAMLVLPGGGAWDQKQNTEAAELARVFLEHDVPVAAICGATAGLARAGLLSEVEHTSNSKDYLAQTGYAGGSYYREQPAVRAGRLITASAMHALEFAREVFSLLDVYPEAVLAAWYDLYRTGDAKYFVALINAAQPQAASVKL